MHCDQCRYALKGLPLDGICPECGLAIAETIRRINERNRRRAQRSWVPVVFGFVLGVVVGMVAISGIWFLAKDGHDVRTPVLLMFPVPLLIGNWFHFDTLVIVLGCGQYPLYGALIGMCWWGTARALWTISLLLTLHVGAWALTLVLLP